MLARHARRDALSLLEVIIALSTFLFSLVGLGFLLSVSGNMALDGHYKSHAANLCQAKLAEVAAGAVPLEGSGETPFEDDPDYQWSLATEQAGTQGLYTVTVTVSRKRPDGSSVECSLAQMVLDPKNVGSVFDTPTTTEDTTATEDTSTASSSQPSTSGQDSSTSSGAAKSGGMGQSSASKGGGGKNTNKNTNQNTNQNTNPKPTPNPKPPPTKNK